jgi:hypothetical protein
VWHEIVTASSPVSLLSSHSALSAAGKNHLHHVCTWNSQPHKLVYSIHTKDLAAERNGFLVPFIILSPTTTENSMWECKRLKNLQNTRKQRLIMITLFFTYMLYKTTLHSITLLLKEINTTLIVLNKRAWPTTHNRKLILLWWSEIFWSFDNAVSAGCFETVCVSYKRSPKWISQIWPRLWLTYFSLPHINAKNCHRFFMQVPCYFHMHIVTSWKMCQPESAMPRRPAETMMSEEMTCEQGPTLKPIITYVTTVQWLIISTMKLEHKRYKAMC